MMRRMARSNVVAFFIALIITSPLILWAIDRSDPVIVHEFHIEPTSVRAGQTAYRVVEVTRKAACPTDVDVILIDGARVRWFLDEPEVVRPGPVGVRDKYYAPFIVPALAAPGPAELRVTVSRRCNPLHRIWPVVTQYPALRFTITRAN